MKSYTDLGQSKKLAEILPLESADMWWAERYEAYTTADWEYVVADKPIFYISLVKPSDSNVSQDIIKDIPCWSLASLLNILPMWTLDSSESPDKQFRLHCKEHFGEWCDNPVDACYEMIIKLRKNNSL